MALTRGWDLQVERYPDNSISHVQLNGSDLWQIDDLRKLARLVEHVDDGWIIEAMDVIERMT